MKNVRWFVALAAVLAGAMVMPAAAGALAGQQSSGTIKVGSIAPATNPSGGTANTDQAKALAIAIKAFNKRGGVMGKKLVLDYCDSKSDVNQEASCARQMVDDHVVATLDDYTFYAPDAVAKVLGDAGIPRVGLNYTSLADWKSPVSYGLSAGPVAAFEGMGAALIKDGHKKLAEVIAQSPSSPTVKSILNPGLKSLGGEIVTEVFIPPGTSDYTQYVAAATKDGATAALMLLDYPQMAPFMDAMSTLNSKLVLGINGSAVTLDNLKKYSKYAKTASIVDSTPNATSSPKKFPGLKQYVADMKAGGLSINQLNGQSMGAWLSVLAFKTVVEGAKPATIDASSVMAALNTAKDVDLQGLIPPWTPNATNPSPIFTRVSNPYMYQQKFNGKTVDTITPAIDVMAILNAKG